MAVTSMLFTMEEKIITFEKADDNYSSMAILFSPEKSSKIHKKTTSLLIRLFFYGKKRIFSLSKHNGRRKMTFFKTSIAIFWNTSKFKPIISNSGNAIKIFGIFFTILYINIYALLKETHGFEYRLI